MPGLVWNVMMSVSGGWFSWSLRKPSPFPTGRYCCRCRFLYHPVAIGQRDLSTVGYAILAMLAVILLTDQLLFRPLVAWADKFKFEFAESQNAPRSWFLELLRRTPLDAGIDRAAGGAMGMVAVVHASATGLSPALAQTAIVAARSILRLDYGWMGLLGAVAVASIVLLARLF